MMPCVIPLRRDAKVEKNMRRIIWGLLLFIVPVVCFAQGKEKRSAPKPDLTGAGVLDEANSTTDLGEKDRITDYTLTIMHHEPEIKMSKRYRQGGREVSDDVTYYTDGRPEYSSLSGVRDPEPTTRWRGRRLVRRSVKELHGPLKLRIETEEEWLLSEDGQTLTRTVLNLGMGRDSKSKYVFTRLPKA
jgi:hypothetical protein